MKISVDLDGVLASFTKQFVKTANKVLPDRKIPVEFEPSDWNYTGCFSKEEIGKIWQEIKATINFWQGLPEYTDNIAALREYWNNNPETDIYFITSRVETAGCSPLAQSAVWLSDRGLYPRNGHGSVVVVSNPLKKASVMEALGIQYSIDDYPSTVQNCNELVGHEAFLLDRKWNQEAVGLPRVKSMAEYLSIIRMVQKGQELMRVALVN